MDGLSCFQAEFTLIGKQFYDYNVLLLSLPQGNEEIISAMRFAFERMKVIMYKEKVCFNGGLMSSLCHLHCDCHQTISKSYKNNNYGLKVYKQLNVVFSFGFLMRIFLHSHIGNNLVW